MIFLPFMFENSDANQMRQVTGCGALFLNSKSGAGGSCAGRLQKEDSTMKNMKGMKYGI